ncbi:M20/M25/M40 family metallo-hydrolase [soil metagenome]
MSIARTLDAHRDSYLGWLSEACSIPSVATEPDGLETMASWLQDKLEGLGANVERLPHEGAPDVLLAELGEGPRTVLVYDHYDVQPVDPIELWRSPPFSPEVRDGIFFARGAADNKGDLVARLAALHAYVETHGGLPVTIKLLAEGEEETGSRSFAGIVDRWGHRLAADGCIWEGHGVDHAGRPSFVFGAKGLAYAELSFQGLAEDQHSSVAVVAPSPVWHLVEALSTLRAPNGRVLIEGFYDDVVAPDESDYELLARIPFEEDAERKRLGIREFVGGDAGPELVRRFFFEPTCNIAGIVAGYTVPGKSKTVLPREAMAKIDMRLVPEQDPTDIVTKLRAHLEARGYGDIEVSEHSMETPVRSPIDSLIGRASLRAAGKVYEQDPVIAPMMIGTGPMHHIAGGLGIPTVSTAGVFRPDSAIHAPNENCRVEDFFRTIEYTAAWIDELASIEA